jgi:hypothetical protein
MRIFTKTSLLFFLLPAFQVNAQPGFIWGTQTGGINSRSYGTHSTAVDANGNVYMTGYFGDSADFDPGPGTANLVSAGASDIFICKWDAAGNFVWAIRFGGPFEDLSNAIDIDKSGNIYVTGGFQDTVDFDPGPGSYTLVSPQGFNMYVAKFRSNGSLVWAVKSGGEGNVAPLTWLTVNGAEEVLVVGNFNDTVDFDPGQGIAEMMSSEGKMFILKLTSSGTYIWAKQVGGENCMGGTTSVSADSAGYIYVSGALAGQGDFDPGPGIYYLNSTSTWGCDAFVVKVDVSGNFIWAETFGVTSTSSYHNTYCRSMVADESGNVYLTGDFSGTEDFDPGTNTFNMTSFSFSNDDVYVIKLDANGNFAWAKRIGGTPTENGESIEIDNAGNVWTAGSFSYTVDFDPGPGIYNLYTPWQGAFVLGLNSYGDLLCAGVFTGGPGDQTGGNSIAADPSGNIYFGGMADGTTDLDPTPASFQISSPNGNSFLVKLTPCSTSGYEEENDHQSFTLFPDPSNGLFTLSGITEPTELKIFNSLGQEIYTSHAFTRASIDLSDRPKGIYFVQLMNEKGSSTKKMIIE